MRLNKTIGRDQIPGDEVAFNRLAKIFPNTPAEPINTQRRQRNERSDGKTTLSTKDTND